MIHTVKSFGIVNKAEADFFSGILLLFDDPMDVGFLSLFKIQLEYQEVHVHVLLKPGLENFEHYFASV